MMLADLAPRSEHTIPVGLWIALVVVVVVAVFVTVVMRPLRGWRSFATRHGLVLSGDTMSGEVDGRKVEISLVRADDGPPRTRVVIGALERDAVGRMNEAALEAALAEALRSGHA